MKVVFLNPLGRLWLEKIEGLRRAFGDVEFVTAPERAQTEAAEADALVAGELTDELLARCRRVRMVFVPYAGPDGLPFEAIQRRGIRVANVHGNAPDVAERAVAMALSFYGRVVDYHNDLKAHRWHGYWATGDVRDSWESMQGRACAVVGTGAIGQHIATYLKVFDCPVVGVRRRPAAGAPENFDTVTGDLGQALAASELVFVTLPLTDATRGLFSAEVLAGMHGKFLVNVGRGPVVDEAGLYHALKGGVLKGAAIDVWYTYPQTGDAACAPPSRYPFHELPNVILSPHLAGFTPQAARRNIEQTMANIRAFLQTGRALSEVDPAARY